ncbi:MAG: hypothetical protein SGI92_29550 [Bryobacteraceae bacterium]|nr:hypothetical protein [Bryobacteraceae bacterium]
MILNRLPLIMLGAVVGVLQGQEAPRKPRTPFAYEFNIGGMGALSKTSADYSNSIVMGGGASLPITRWINIDLANLDFGFGTAGGPRTISVSDGSKRTTKNYHGGYGTVAQNEYVPSRTYYHGGVQ